MTDDMKGEVTRRIISTLVRLEGKVDDLADRMVTKEELSSMTKAVQGLAGRIDDMRYDWAKHDARLSGLERRSSRS